MYDVDDDGAEALEALAEYEYGLPDDRLPYAERNDITGLPVLWACCSTLRCSPGSRRFEVT
ncbi:hypothetical protein [Paraburkholderia nodosa]|uniref:hypothetical protein n=1 Tax=Paraburkholderia nodosa TaxID=392320 RepID=UPI0012B69825|nr:hypothetical protein [Paraburkholderia nodosa]